MPVISNLGRRSLPGKMMTLFMYLALTVLGTTMVVPFLITVSSSISNDYDYERFRPLPRYLHSQEDRFAKGLVRYFNSYAKWYEQLNIRYTDIPANWTSWREIGRDIEGTDKLAARYLNPSEEELVRWKRIAADYSDFALTYPVADSLTTVGDLEAASFIKAHYTNLFQKQNPEAAAEMSKAELRAAALELMNETWGIPMTNFYLIGFETSEGRRPYWQQSWFPSLSEPKYRDYLRVKEAAAFHVFTPGVESKWFAWVEANHPDAHPIPTLVQMVDESDPLWQERFSSFRREVAPATPTVPFGMRAIWYSYFTTDEARDAFGLELGKLFDVNVYNRAANTNYTDLAQIPFPPPAETTPVIREMWRDFVENRYPVRLITVDVTPELEDEYQAFLEERFKTLDYANRMLNTSMESWEEFKLAREALYGPEEDQVRSVWSDFVKKLPVENRQIHSSEISYQAFLMERYGTVEAVNAAYGWELAHLHEASPPFDIAYAVTFLQNEWSLSLLPIAHNYDFILTFMFERGRAIFVTIVLIVLTILMTLTVNPMAAYALSRFSLPNKDKIVLFLLATMAFPAMVSAIPAYLLMRDLGLLNTFFALILPGAANGMSIFILKGFFDSLPQELYEAATIDGAKEWQIFLIITMPMMKPILAINALNAFIAAYNGWQWALIICQDQDMWTLSVWMYQASQWWSLTTPWLVMAGFVIVSIPTLVVFMFCQKIIMRGIIVPSMK